jgi:hypothetical protein
MSDEARLAFVHVDDVPWTEVIAQLHGARRVSVHEKFLEWSGCPTPGSRSRTRHRIETQSCGP